MRAANDNGRPPYRRKPYYNQEAPKEKRPIYAWEIDSTLDPMSKAGQEIVGFG